MMGWGDVGKWYFFVGRKMGAIHASDLMIGYREFLNLVYFLCTQKFKKWNYLDRRY